MANAALSVGLDALRRTISVDEARQQLQRLTAGEPQKSANAMGAAEIDKLFGDDDTITGGGQEDDSDAPVD